MQQATGSEPLGAVMGTLARFLQTQHKDVDATLQAITNAVLGTVPGAEQAGISMVRRGRTVQARAATDPVVEKVDELQTELGEGPCLQALFEHETVSVPDMSTERRWPTFAAAAHAAGVGSMLSFQLFVEQENLGALNLYSASPGAFDDHAEHVGLLFAAHAAIAIAGAKHEEHLQTALASRDLIGQAKGMLMQRFELTAEDAFTLLARLSQEENIKIRDMVERITSTGAIPADAPPPRD